MHKKEDIKERQREMINRYQCPVQRILLNLLFRLSGIRYSPEESRLTFQLAKLLVT